MKIVVNNFSHVWLCLQVACRQLGFTLAVDVRVSSFYGGGEGMVWLDRVGCSGEEVEVNDNQNKCLTFFFFLE